MCMLTAALAHAAHGAPVGRDADLLRTGWYPDQPGLGPQALSGGTFGQIFQSPVDGQVYAQPLVFGGTLFIATMSNWIYGLDPATGALLWSRNVGTPWNPNDIGCTDIEPTVGICSTPVIDDATGVAYFTSKTYANGDSGTALWNMHAVSLVDGTEQSGFPVALQGTADNQPGQTFTPTTQLQRPALLLMGAVVYAAFGSLCDVEPFQGWVFGVSTTGVITCRWVDITPDVPSGAGIWMSGSGLVTDTPGQILLVTGNGWGVGTTADPTPGTSPPPNLGEAVVRLGVQGDGTLQPINFFTPINAFTALDSVDGDMGSGGIVGLPYPYFGTASYRNLFVQLGKSGVLYLLDGTALGGYAQGPGGGDQVVQALGHNGDGGAWSKPAVWGGDGGWVYVATADTSLSPDGSYGWLRAYSAGLDTLGRPALTLAATSVDRFGFTSSPPIITSTGSTSGSALLWIIWNPDFTGYGSELRAYDVLPVNGAFHELFSAPLGRGPKFNPPGVWENHLYVGTRDGYVIAFAGPVDVAGAKGRPATTRLSPAYPNPFARATTMDFSLARGGPATLAIYDVSGRRVRSLVSGVLPAGSRRVEWDGRDDGGERVPAGLYFARLACAELRQTRRVIVLR